MQIIKNQKLLHLATQQYVVTPKTAACVEFKRRNISVTFSYLCPIVKGSCAVTFCGKAIHS